MAHPHIYGVISIGRSGVPGSRVAFDTDEGMYLLQLEEAVGTYSDAQLRDRLYEAIDMEADELTKVLDPRAALHGGNA